MVVMSSSPHPHRSAAHQLQHPEHASYSPSSRSAGPYPPSARASRAYPSASTPSTPEPLNDHERAQTGSRTYRSPAPLHTPIRPSSSPKHPAPPPAKRRKQSQLTSPPSQLIPHDSAALRTSSPDPKPSFRVAKACQPCSTKKRRCDGRQPQCSVCQVLGTPCTYNHTGLKRGPPKGFRAGPRESARAKLVRTLETTIRDLVNHLGKQDAGLEIVRVSSERDLPISESQRTRHTHPDGSKASTHSGDVDLIDVHPNSKIQIEHLTSTSHTEPTPFHHSTHSEGEEDERAAEAEEDVIGETRQGELVYRGSSSGIGILQRQHRAESPSGPTAIAANRSIASSSSAPYAGLDPAEKAQHPRAPVFLPISSPRPVGDAADTASSQDRSPRSNKLAATRETSNFRSMYPGSRRDGPTSAVSEDPAVSDEDNDRLFRYYWQGFHPFYPILYKPWFVGFSREELRANLEPSLLYAIYAIGACVVPANTAQHSVLQPESSLHRRNLERAQSYCHAAERCVLAKGLRPDIASIQTCWLLSLYSHGTGDLSRAWNFQNLASSMAVDMGLHRWPIYRPEIVQDRVQRETRIRIIWHCYIVDKLLCAEMGRPVGLRAKDIDVPLLSETEEDEFELWSDQTEMQTVEHADARPASVTSASSRRLHAPSCLNWGVHLFKIVERILDEVHSLRRKALLRSQGKEQVLTDLDRQLTEWKDKLPRHLHLDDSPSDGPFPSFFALNLWYYTARLLLHRPFIPQEEGLAMSKVVSNDSHRQSTLAANTICDLLEASSRDIVDRLSTDLGYCLFTAAVMFVFNARLPDANIAQDARRRYGLCMQWLKKLADTWPAASAHRLLLEGFAVVGEDASKQGADAARRRPSIAALQAARVGTGLGSASKVSNWIAETEGALHESSGNKLSRNGKRASTWTRNSAVAQHGQTSPAIQPQNGNADSKGAEHIRALTDSWDRGGGRIGVDAVGEDGPSAGMGLAGNSSIDFAPGIFDVESFFWNENGATASTLLGTNMPTLPFHAMPVLSDQAQPHAPTVPYGQGGFTHPTALGNFDQLRAAQPTLPYVPSFHPPSSAAATAGRHVAPQVQPAPLAIATSQSLSTTQNPTCPNPEQVAPFSTSPFAFNPAAHSIGEFWSMLELPPAFLQQ